MDCRSVSDPLHGPRGRPALRRRPDYLLTGGLALLGVLYDLWTLNAQVDAINRGGPSSRTG
ncbi:MAG: hypothetical protein PVG98_13615 [Chromatiales bacterium]|jgi:hypothetical protein